MKTNAPTRYGVSLLSGGLDSTVVTAHAAGKTDHLTALTFHYGQSHGWETACAKEVSDALGIPNRLLDISSFGQAAWYSALTNPDHFPVPQDQASEPGETSIPITYVPLRNTLFLTLAAALLESQVLHDIEVAGVEPASVEALVFMGPNAVDYSGYPDCRPEYFQQMSKALAHGSKLSTEYHVPIHLETPIIDKSKADIVRMGLDLKAPLEITWSCYRGETVPCGSCDSCVIRARGFAEAKVPDPLLQRLGVGS